MGSGWRRTVRSSWAAGSDVPQPTDTDHRAGDGGGPDGRMEEPAAPTVLKNPEPEQFKNVARPKEDALDGEVEPDRPAHEGVLDFPAAGEVVGDEHPHPGH